MKCELLKNKAKAAEPPVARNERFQLPVVKGSTVCYHQPLYNQPLSRLQSAIHDGASLRKLDGRYYKMQSNGGYIHQYYPAVEYYKIAYRMVRDTTHTILLAKEDIQRVQDEIQEIYASRNEKLSTGQTKLSFDKDIYRLRSSLTTYIFSVRASLDTIASMFQTIYGPRIGQHTSLNGLMSHVLSGKCEVDDPVLARYFKHQMEWFVLLKDVRDYLAHFGAIEFSIKECASGALEVEMFGGMGVNVFVDIVDHGFGGFLDFLDVHGAKVASCA